MPGVRALDSRRKRPGGFRRRPFARFSFAEIHAIIALLTVYAEEKRNDSARELAFPPPVYFMLRRSNKAKEEKRNPDGMDGDHYEGAVRPTEQAADMAQNGGGRRYLRGGLFSFGGGSQEIAHIDLIDEELLAKDREHGLCTSSARGELRKRGLSSGSGAPARALTANFPWKAVRKRTGSITEAVFIRSLWGKSF